MSKKKRNGIECSTAYYPDLFERGSYTDWEKKGGQTLLERASARVEKLLLNHQPEPLPEDVKAKLRKIVERAYPHILHG